MSLLKEFMRSGPTQNMRRTLQKRVLTKTCLYSFDPFKPHFYIVKLGFTGLYIIFLILLENIDCGYSLEPPRRGGSNEYPQSMFSSKMRKIFEFCLKIFNFSMINYSVYLNRHVFVMVDRQGTKQPVHPVGVARAVTVPIQDHSVLEDELGQQEELKNSR